MRLKTAELVNVCQHRKLKLDFPLGVTGVFGPNGSGKSNLVKMIKANLTGDFTVNPGNKEENIRRGAPESAPSYILGEWQHEGTDFELVRSLRPNKNTLTISGQSPISKAGEITDVVEGLLSLPKRIINEFVFVDQWSIFAFMSTQPADRAKLFSHLCNTDRAEVLWKTLGDQATQDQELAATFIDNSDEIRHRRKERLAKVKELKTKLAKEKTHILKKAEGRKLKEEIEIYKRLEFLKERRDARKVDLHNATAQAATAEERFKEVDDSLSKARKKWPKLSAEAENVKYQLSEIQKVKKLHDRVKTLKASITAAEPSPPTPVADYVEPAELHERQRAIQAEIDEIASVMALLESGQSAECPLCGGTIKNPEAQLKALRKRTTLRIQEAAKLATRVGPCLEYFAKRESWIRDKTVYLSRKQSAEEELAQLGDVPAVPDEEKLKQALRQYEAQADLMNALEEGHRVRQNKLNTLIAKKEVVQRELDELDTELGTLEQSLVTEKTAKLAQKKLNQHREARVAVEGLRRTVEEWEAFVEEDDEALDRIEVLKERTTSARKWLEDMERWRSVVHRDALPRLVAQHMLEELEDKINETLAEFDGPFRVTSDEDLTFLAHKPNGVVEPAARLSGGEKVVLALAFRFAVNSLFAGEIGMMVLDEPTAGLDEHNIGCLTDVLERLSDLTKKRGQQLIIITHDHRLERVFDNVIRLEKAA